MNLGRLLGMGVGLSLAVAVNGCADGTIELDEGRALARSQQALQQGPCTTTDAPNQDAANLQKYADYRARLRNQYIRVSAGDEPGTNIPISKRYQGTAQWGDSTILIGSYLSMLATEYALFEDRQPANALTTLKEIHYALKALDRLDRVAESYFRPDASEAAADLNGFFIREDVRSDFFTKFPMAGVTTVDSGITSPYPYGEKPEYRATEMSQDQVWHLLVGLALVKKLVPFTGAIDGEPVAPRAHAKTITFRILRYMIEHDDWRTQNPVFDKDVLRGADTEARMVFSYGFATAGNWILSPDAPGDPTYPDLHNTSSMNAQLPFTLARFGKADNYNQRSLATVGNLDYSVTLGNTFSGTVLQKLEYQVTNDSLFKYEQLPLIYTLLHGGTTSLDTNLYGGLLNAAPAGGPFNYGEDNRVCAWSSVSRVIWPENNALDDPWWQGDYNGIDYLLLHNLFQLTFNSPKLDALYGPRSSKAPSATSTTPESNDESNDRPTSEKAAEDAPRPQAPATTDSSTCSMGPGRGSSSDAGANAVLAAVALGVIAVNRRKWGAGESPQ